MFTAEAIIVGVFAAILVGISKTGLPGGGLLAVPLIATVYEGRLIAGAALPMLIAADLFALGWYRQHARWDLLRPLAPGVTAGYAVGITFFVVVGKAARPIDVAIGVIIMIMVVIQLVRMIRRQGPHQPTRSAAVRYGAAGGFTTFVSNSAGPIINTYFTGLGLDKHEQVGTSAWFYFIVNVTKIPFYLVLGWATTGGSFFTGESLLWNLATLPAVVAGVFLGRVLFARISQRAFGLAVLVLSAAAAVNLLV